MRVVMIVSPTMAWAVDWVEAARTVADVAVVSVAPRDADTVDLRWRSVGVDRVVPKVRLHPARLLGHPVRRLQSSLVARAVRSVAQDRGPVDVLHVHTYHHAAWTPAVARATGLPFVVTEHSTRLTLEPAAHKQPSATGLRLAARAYASAAEVIAVSEYLRYSLESRGLPGTKIVVPNPLDTALFSPAHGASSGDHLRIVSVGRLAPEKRPDLLLEAFASLAASDEHLTLEFVGDGELRPALQQTAADRGLASRVQFAGHQPREEVANRVRNADVFALASVVETFCVAGAEALACGLPIVVPDATATPELLAEAKDGVSFRRDDPAALATALQAALRLAATSEPDDRACRAQRFSYSAVGAQLADVYDRAAASNALDRR